MQEDDMTLEQDHDPEVGVQALSADVLAVPAGISEEEAGQLRAQAAEVVGELRQASGSKAMEIIDRISAVGLQSQRRAGTDLALLRTRVGELIAPDGGGAGATIARTLVELRVS